MSYGHAAWLGTLLWLTECIILQFGIRTSNSHQRAHDGWNISYPFSFMEVDAKSIVFTISPKSLLFQLIYARSNHTEPTKMRTTTTQCSRLSISTQAFRYTPTLSSLNSEFWSLSGSIDIKTKCGGVPAACQMFVRRSI